MFNKTLARLIFRLEKVIIADLLLDASFFIRINFFHVLLTHSDVKRCTIQSSPVQSKSKLGTIKCHFSAYLCYNFTCALLGTPQGCPDAPLTLQGVQKSRPRGKIRYLWNRSKFFRQIYSAYRGVFRPHILQNSLQ